MSARAKIASHIRMTLAQRGWSAARLARMAGISPSTITRALDDDGEFVMSNKTLAAVLPHLIDDGTKHDALLFGDASVPPRVSPSEVLQPASRPGGSDETGRRFPTPEDLDRVAQRENRPDIGKPISNLTVANGRVTLKLDADVSVGTAAKILALIEGDRG